MTLLTLFTNRSWFTMILTVSVIAAVCSISSAAPKLNKYTTKYYVLHTDLDKDMTRQAVVRITAMAEEYFNRTRSFAGRINTRFPLYLYKNRKEYNKHPGVISGSAGMYNGRSLIATAPRPGGSWRVVQHEGFHQFAHKVIKGHLPVWLNEGLAEYFGRGVWTGDKLVVGLISKGSLGRVQGAIKGDSLMPLGKMLEMSQKDWNSKLSSRNYLQAWSMVHFLVHADNGKYQKALSGYIRDLSTGRSSSAVFRKWFGSNTKAFQACYVQWWTRLPDNPTAELYERIKVFTLTSYLARAYCTRREFETFEAFATAASDGTFDKVFAEIGKLKPMYWLPVSLLTRTMPSGSGKSQWSLLEKPGFPRLKLTRSDGSSLVGSFTLGNRISVTVAKTLAVSKKPTVKPSTKPVAKK
ncbi:MAG: DUF1570 domain-containing protein [Phycisphaerae bacterium]|nr:DUF1570 domain-containing protein [Phycisphaerae bacterium]